MRGTIPDIRTISDYKREIIIDLFLQTPPFWTHISALRTEWGIAVQKRVPPDLPLYLWVQHLPLPELSEGGRMRFVQALSDLHDQVIPPKYRYRRSDVQDVPSNAPVKYQPTWRDGQQVGGALLDQVPNGIAISPFLDYPEGKRDRWEYSSALWQRFLANCVCYAPPDNQLEEFAQAANGGIEESKVQRLPIVWLADPVETLEIERQYWEAKCRRLDEEVLSILGFLEQKGLRDEYIQYMAQRSADDSGRGFGREYQERVAQIEVRPFISVEDDPDDNVVKEAVRALRGGKRPRGPAGRNRLRALQIFILNRDHKWPCVRIAEHYGQTLSEGSYNKKRGKWLDRSTVAQDWVTAGREIFEQKVSAE